jgi:hypothetical protein
MEDKERRVICIGDIHGALFEFRALLDKVKYDPANDRVILLGDLIDRGPFSAETVRFARENNFESVLGNHDLKFLKWFRGHKDKPLYDHRKFYDQFDDADIDYIHKMPLYIWIKKDFVAVHAGVLPNIPIEKQKKDDLCYLRYTDKDRNFLSLKKVFKEKIPAHFWTDFGPFGYSVIYGHNVHSPNNVEITRYSDGTACYGIDTGVVFGGHLSAAILQGDKEIEIVQVAAKQMYHKSDFKAL